MKDKILAQWKKLDNVKRKWKQLALLLALILCLGLSLGNVCSCNFAKVKVYNRFIEGSVSYYYGLFMYENKADVNFGRYSNDITNNYFNGDDDYSGGSCYAYNNKSRGDKYLWESTTIRSTAQGFGLLTVFMLIVSVVMVSTLKCIDFSSSIIHWIQFVLIIALASNIVMYVLVLREGFNKFFEEQKKVSGLPPKFSLYTGAMVYAIEVIIFFCLIFTCCCSCSKLPETDDDTDSKVEVVVKVEPPIHIPDEEAEIYIPKEEDEPQVYVA